MKPPDEKKTRFFYSYNNKLKKVDSYSVGMNFDRI